MGSVAHFFSKFGGDCLYTFTIYTNCCNVFLLDFASETEAKQEGMAKFGVIVFEEGNEIAVVPDTWLLDGKCYWPQYCDTSKLNRAIKESHPRRKLDTVSSECSQAQAMAKKAEYS
ncbi:uncharacterized protein LOC143022498 isoform X1 [Oratosquilla oratoria]|uniref:uncharacterized protein LOC143022498 isoform X1 n=1 Tax=Oratosquilla oratoria TaxID=337810 RepID=UPI003F76B06B